MERDDRIVGRIWTRRDLLTAGAALAVGARFARLLRAEPATQPTARKPLIATPEVTEGPFFIDEELNRSDLIVGETRPSVIDGLPLALTLVVYRLVNGEATPLKGAHVDLWHADMKGVYSDEANRMNHEDTSGQKWLRGYQVADESGKVSFRTIYPGWYPGRSPHIHFKVRELSADKKTTRELTSQLFLTDAERKRIYSNPPYVGMSRGGPTNSQDGIYSERLPDGSPVGSRLLLDITQGTGPGGAASSEFAIYLTNEAAHRGGRRRGPGPGRDGGPPPPPPFDGPPPFGPPPDR